jgi:hypothetical protein
MKEKLIGIIQNAVGGCTAYWASLIADALIENGLLVVGKAELARLLTKMDSAQEDGE